MKTTIIDNWLEDDLANFLLEYMLQLQYRVDHASSVGDGSEFLMADFPLTPLFYFLLKKINKEKNVSVLRAYVNLHYFHQSGSWHQDDGQITFLYMPSKNITGGEFEIKDEGKFDYKFNRLIYFDAAKEHKGNAPTNNSKRLTLAFKTILV